MKLRHYFINFVDLPEVLPFTVSEEKMKELKGQEESGKKLFNFIEALEEEYGPIHYIGQDNIADRFYQRFMFASGGFLEVMQKAPSAVIAHFPKEEQAKEFAEVLKKTIKDRVEDKKAADLLAQDIEISKEEKESLSYERWSKLRNVRESIDL